MKWFESNVFCSFNNNYLNSHVEYFLNYICTSTLIKLLPSGLVVGLIRSKNTLNQLFIDRICQTKIHKQSNEISIVEIVIADMFEINASSL